MEMMVSDAVVEMMHFCDENLLVGSTIMQFFIDIQDDKEDDEEEPAVDAREDDEEDEEDDAEDDEDDEEITM